MSHASQVDQLIEALPYSLTEAQNKVLKEVSRDLESGLVMNRLIQGDVGSGKTIIAVLACSQTACNGFRAIDPPTEVWQDSILNPLPGLLRPITLKKQQSL